MSCFAHFKLNFNTNWNYLYTAVLAFSHIWFLFFSDNLKVIFLNLLTTTANDENWFIM